MLLSTTDTLETSGEIILAYSRLNAMQYAIPRPSSVYRQRRTQDTGVFDRPWRGDKRRSGLEYTCTCDWLSMCLTLSVFTQALLNGGYNRCPVCVCPPIVNTAKPLRPFVNTAKPLRAFIWMSQKALHHFPIHSHPATSPRSRACRWPSPH